MTLAILFLNRRSRISTYICQVEPCLAAHVFLRILDPLVIVINLFYYLLLPCLWYLSNAIQLYYLIFHYSIFPPLKSWNVVLLSIPFHLLSPPEISLVMLVLPEVYISDFFNEGHGFSYRKCSLWIVEQILYNRYIEYSHFLELSDTFLYSMTWNFWH